MFVDAILPHPGATWFETAPVSLREQLGRLTTGGWLPPWDQWFPPGTLDSLLPDSPVRARFIAALPRLPLAYFEERAPATPDRIHRYAYLQLSDAYHDAADDAEQGPAEIRAKVGHKPETAAGERPRCQAGRGSGST